MGRKATHSGTVFDPPPVEALAARPFGVFAVWQAGLTPSAIRSRVARGKLHRVHRGVYAVGHPVLTGDGRFMAAVLACGPNASLSYRSGAAHWAIRPSARATIDVTVRHGSVRARPGIDIHRARSVATTVHAGIPCTTPMQTVVDLADVLDRRGVERAIEQTEVLQLFDLRALEACLPGRRGAPVIRAILATYTGDTVTKSEMEELFLALCREHGIPQPLVNAYVEGDERDFVWPTARLIVETDGRATHRTRTAFERDRARDQRAVVAGWRVLRFTWRQLTDTPQDVAAYTSSIVSASSPTSRNFV